MKFSEAFIPTLKEAPAEATLKSHILMIRAGMIRKVGSGIYSLLPYGLALVKNIKQIIREEMNAKGAVEMAMPLLIPKVLLDKSGRWKTFKRELFRLIDRHEADFALSPTNEETFTQLVLEEINSYRQLPINLYQINHKFRDEIRPRYGMIRGKEFIMKDAYSFHLNDVCLDETYKKMSDAYHRIFYRCGLDFVNVRADSGAMGGRESEEFMVKSDVGEEFIIYCSCGYTSNIEAAEEMISYDVSVKSNGNQIKKVYTPGAKTITMVREFLSIPVEKSIKTMVYEMYIQDTWYPFIAIIRGDYEINLVKLENWAISQGADEIRSASEIVVSSIFGDDCIGYLGIKNLKYQAPVVWDISLRGMIEGVIGANEKDYHYIGINLEQELKNCISHEASIYTAREKGNCPRCEKPLELFKGIEVGHIFKLGRKYTQSFNLHITYEEGKSITPTMGCYGIGVTRILAACIEQMGDDHGVILPASIAPYKVIIITLNPEESTVMEASKKLYRSCQEKSLFPLWDDRKERAGFKFKDADLLGIPLQVVVGKKSIAIKEYEVRVRNRNKNLVFNINVDETPSFLLKKYQEILNKP